MSLNIPEYAQPKARWKIHDLVSNNGFVSQIEKVGQLSAFLGGLPSKVSSVLQSSAIDEENTAKQIFEMLCRYNHNSMYFLYNIGTGRPINDPGFSLEENLGTGCFEFVPEVVRILKRSNIESHVLTDIERQKWYPQHVCILANISWRQVMLDPTIGITVPVFENERVKDVVVGSGKQSIMFKRNGMTGWNLEIDISDGPKAQQIRIPYQYWQRACNPLAEPASLSEYVTAILHRDNAKVYRFDRDWFWNGRRTEYRVDFSNEEETLVIHGQKFSNPTEREKRNFCATLEISFPALQEMRAGMLAWRRKVISALWR